MSNANMGIAVADMANGKIDTTSFAGYDPLRAKYMTARERRADETSGLNCMLCGDADVRLPEYLLWSSNRL